MHRILVVGLAAVLAMSTLAGCGSAPPPPPMEAEQAPPPPPPPAPEPEPPPVMRTLQQGDLGDVFFDFDKADIRGDQHGTLTTNSDRLRDATDSNVLIEGHCDERGTNDYNLALGDRRARSARDFLVNNGVSGARIELISYGESRPFSDGHDESAWAQNRRAHFVVRNP